MQLSRVLMGLSAAVQDWTPAFEKSGEDLVRFFSYDVFESEGQAIDDLWTPLSAAYAKRKEKLYPDKGILDATGLMRESFMSQADPTSLKIWNAVEYFKYHQSIEPRSKLPRRVMMRLTTDLREVVIKNFQTQFQERAGSL